MKKILSIGLILMLVFAFTACGNYEGEYQDEISQRATMSLEKDGNVYNMEINWAQSASEACCWQATGTFEGNKLEYTSGKLHQLTYDDKGMVTNDKITDGQKGTLTVQDDGKIKWEGQDDGEECLFVEGK